MRVRIYREYSLLLSGCFIFGFSYEAYCGEVSMRLIVSFRHDGRKSRPDKHSVQSMLYHALGDSQYGRAHNVPRFRFFTFSDFFRNKREEDTLIISSPISRLIGIMGDWFRERDSVTLDGETLRIARVSQRRLRLSDAFESGSPVTLYRDSQSGTYVSLEKSGDFAFFLERLMDNAVKKYAAFTGQEPDLKGPIFDEYVLRKEVVVRVEKSTGPFDVVGSVWKRLVKHDVYDNSGFYNFLMECGLGEKNSLGFGFVNPVRCK